MTLGCETFSVEGGEVLRFKFERDFVHKETGYWIGVGASASMPTISLGGSSGLSDSGNGEGGMKSPKWAQISGGVTAEVMVGVRVSDSGAIQDIGMNSTVTANGSAAGASATVGLSGSISMENGPSVSPVLSAKAH